MSLLDKTTEDILVFPQEEWVDRQGNTMLRTVDVGIPARATIQPAAQSGTSARRSEQDNEGYETEENYRLRFSRSFTLELGIAAQIEWRGTRWSIVGHATHYNGSRRTAHTDYMIRRA